MSWWTLFASAAGWLFAGFLFLIFLGALKQCFVDDDDQEIRPGSVNSAASAATGTRAPSPRVFGASIEQLDMKPSHDVSAPIKGGRSRSSSDASGLDRRRSAAGAVALESLPQRIQSPVIGPSTIPASTHVSIAARRRVSTQAAEIFSNLSAIVPTGASARARGPSSVPSSPQISPLASPAIVLPPHEHNSYLTAQSPILGLLGEPKFTPVAGLETRAHEIDIELLMKKPIKV